MTREQAQAHMRALTKEERRLIEELMQALSPECCKRCGANAQMKEDRKNRKER